MAFYRRGKEPEKGKPDKREWWYSFTFKGTRIQRNSGCSNINDARDVMSAYRTALAKGEVGIVEKVKVPTLKEFSEPFMKHVKVERKEKPRTITFYAEKLKPLVSAFGSLPLDKINEKQIDQYKENRQSAKTRLKRVVSPATINRELATLRKMLRFAHERAVIARVPRIRLLAGERPREFVLSPLQEPIYLAAVPDTLRDIAVLLIETGLRVGEALTLEWAQVRLVAPEGKKFPCLTVRAAHSKSGKSRTLPMSERAVEVLSRWRALRAPKDGRDLVFHKPEGSPLASTLLNAQHRRVVATLNKSESLQPKFPREFCLHSLRHTFGTRLGESGVEAFRIRDLMGHSSVVVSQRYVHPSSDSLEAAYELMVLRRASRNPATLPATLVSEKQQATQ